MSRISPVGAERPYDVRELLEGVTGVDSPHQELRELLQRLLSQQELRIFLRELPHGEDIVGWLRWDSEQAALVSEAVDLLERRQEIDESFFARLEEARPSRMDEIRRVASMWL